MHDEKSEYIERTVINHLKSTQAEIFMQYNNGDRLKLTGMSGDYSTVISDIPVESKTITFTFIECKDGDNNNYSVVNIGTQTWMAENLNYDVGSGNWVYDNNTSNAATYGRLYNWETAMNGAGSSSTNPSGVQGVCPSSWHLPSDAEWKELETHLGMKQSDADDWEWRGTDEGSQLKSTSGWNSDSNGTNESGFTALPSGYRTNTGNFESIADLTYFWSSTQFPGLSDWLWSRKLDYSHEGIGRNSNIKSSGFSIRCVKD